MLFRFTLSNDIEGSLVISEPGGWDSAKFKLERNKDYHSLVEFYDQPLMFYGEDISDNGGIQYIRNIEETQGIDAQISLLIELNETGPWETAFEGLLSIETAKEIDFYKLEMGVIRNDFWQKFINRKGTPVDLSASVDLDGNAITPVSPITLRLPSQVIRKKFNGYYQYALDQYYGTTGQMEDNGFEFIQLGFETGLDNIITEIKSNNIPTAMTNTISSLISVVESGSYTINIKVTNGHARPIEANFSYSTIGKYPVYIRINNETPTILTSANVTYGVDVVTEWTYSDTIDLLVGDEIYIYVEDIYDFSTDVHFLFGIDGFEYSGLFQYGESYINITANTISPDTETESFLIKDAAESILSKLIGQNNVVTSDYLDSCAGLYAIMKGLHVRGYSLADKQFSLSFDDWWKGVEPILNLGLAYENTSPETIRIEPKSYFYNKTTSINFDWVNNIERSYDLDTVFKLIEIGYNKWSAESDSGIDDPQTKRWYNTRFKTVGKEIKILSQFIAASLAIEQTRRNRVEEGKDWRLDDDVMIIALKDTSPYEPELAENFSDVTGLLNYETRYNIRLSVARNFERWKDYFNGCLQWYLTDDYKFSNGEGNYDMTSTLFADDCEAVGVSPEASLSEKQDIEVTSNYLFKPIKYSFVHPMTWEEYQTIRDNPTKAIGISRSDSNHVACFIDLLEYEITRGKATFEVYLADDPI
jgi:hypothetical protein